MMTHLRVLLTLLVIAGLAALAGCGATTRTAGPAPPPPCPTPSTAPLALAVGRRANVPEPVLPQQVQDLVRDVVQAHQPVSAVRVDGAPALAWGAPAPAPASEDRADQPAVAGYLNQARQALGTLRAVAPEADVLRALTLAGAAAGPGGTVVLVDSGLQTTAPLDFATDGLLTAEPDDVVNHLRHGHLLPDTLAHRTVLLVGLGVTAPPQTALDNDLRARITAIWQAVAEASGACVTALARPVGGKSAVDGPAVTPVPVPPPPAFGCAPVTLDEADHVSFVPDTATLRDPPAARQTLRGLATALRERRERVELVGATASDGPLPGQVDLSQQRAETVKRLLVDLGAPADRITTRGVGPVGEGHVPDVGPDGELLPGPAAQNRKVVVHPTCD